MSIVNTMDTHMLQHAAIDLDHRNLLTPVQSPPSQTVYLLVSPFYL